MKKSKFLVGVMGLLSIVSISFSSSNSYELPSKINKDAKYFIFSHNAYVEKKGTDGATKYFEILQTFQSNGYTVISEVRKQRVKPCSYAKTNIVPKVEKLIENGVQPENITVGGHSKGAAISLCVASELNNSKINYLIMAGCDIKPLIKYKLYPDFSKLQGNFLSIYSETDKIAGSCKSTFDSAKNSILSKEVVLKSNDGHKVFFYPQEIWVTPVFNWMDKN